MPSVEQCVAFFKERGHSGYGGEAVTQMEHALQCAMLAEAEGATACLITAALLHDIGHLLHALPDDAPDDGVDDHHEELGYRYLKQIFGDEVSEPVRLHVPAKRYLCTADPDYRGQLSEPSLVSLQLQGGAMNPQELAEFEDNPHANEAIRLRRWDDAGKTPGLKTPPLEYFVSHLQSAFRSKS